MATALPKQLTRRTVNLKMPNPLTPYKKGGSVDGNSEQTTGGKSSGGKSGGIKNADLKKVGRNLAKVNAQERK